MQLMKIVHHHLIYQAKTSKHYDEHSEEKLRKFLYDLLDVINVKCLIPAQFKFSRQKAWTGMVGIITSHITFHYWTIENYIQLDIYSCKKFDGQKAIDFINKFWGSSEVKTLFIDRAGGEDFKIERN